MKKSLIKTMITEKDVRKVVRDYLNILQNLGKLHWHWNLQGLGSYRGLSDLCVVLPEGKILWLELKKPGGRLTEHENNFRNNVEKFGHEYLVIDDVDKIQPLMDWYLDV